MRSNLLRLLPWFFFLSITGCATRSPADHSELISLDVAKALITSRQVVEIFQPHQGCVLLILKNDEIKTFNQPHLDWVLEYVDAQGLRGAIPVSVE